MTEVQKDETQLPQAPVEATEAKIQKGIGKRGADKQKRINALNDPTKVPVHANPKYYYGWSNTQQKWTQRLEAKRHCDDGKFKSGEQNIQIIKKKQEKKIIDITEQTQNDLKTTRQEIEDLKNMLKQYAISKAEIPQIIARSMSQTQPQPGYPRMSEQTKKIPAVLARFGLGQ